MRLSRRISVLALPLIGFLCLFSLPATAQFEIDRSEDEGKVHWELHESVSKVFQTKFPSKYKYKVFPLQIDGRHVAYSTEIISALDGGEANNEKSIVLKAVHTLGEELSYSQVKQTLEKTTRKYEHSAKVLKGAVLTNEDMKHNGFLGKKMYISYTQNGVKYGLRLAVYMTNYAKIEQILIGPAQTMYSYRSDDFFKSIKMFDGIVKDDTPVGVGWIKYPSKNNMFTAKLPPKNSDYTPSLPVFKASPQKETMQFAFNDPVLDQRIFYTATAYKLGRKLGRSQAKKFLISQHISKFVENASPENLKMKDTITDDINKMTMKLIVAPLKKTPYIRVISFDVQYVEDMMLVQEVRSSANHANSGIDRSVFSLMDFHPKKYKAHVATKEEKAAAEAEKKKTPPSNTQLKPKKITKEAIEPAPEEEEYEEEEYEEEEYEEEEYEEEEDEEE